MDKKPSVLIIDDEPEIREILKIKLQDSGFEFAEAASSAEGIELAKKLKPDIIILDVMMPDMDGVETFFRIKENSDVAKTKFFFFTGKGDVREKIVETNRRFAQSSGAVDFLRKEIDLDELVEKLRNALKTS